MTKISLFRGLGLMCAFLFLCQYQSQAQNPTSYYVEEPRTFYGGLILGSNFTQVDGDAFAGYNKIGLNAGGIVYVHLAEHVAMSMEILFSQKGSRLSKPQVSNNGIYDITKYRINLNYAEVPIQINYFDRRKSHFGGGFSYSQLISSSESPVTIPAFPNPDTFSTFKFRRADVNFLLGANLHLVSGFFLNLRFQYSMFSIRKTYYEEFGRASQYNNMWTLRLMYLF